MVDLEELYILLPLETVCEWIDKFWFGDNHGSQTAGLAPHPRPPLGWGRELTACLQFTTLCAGHSRGPERQALKEALQQGQDGPSRAGQGDPPAEGEVPGAGHRGAGGTAGFSRADRVGQMEGPGEKRYPWQGA